ncbi:hypothetical protein SAMN06297129_0007 [Pseudooceanicola antarcticus]|uniref:Uncharacterized protein n=1 Tax=Pseudooceanicola antarcticus TaxID=1247613 RepID=A0A285HI80_9RHOB|nr:hypothetical protein [Pseudooceanicola antarcticus]PJE28002.1 hypothetical protein CVM39_15740 [Pseudooceanicola antarcticus]SNY35377.1 hypothetical protein SAMN06297129_0007 [Pseudooceanicola antarcticus]
MTRNAAPDYLTRIARVRYNPAERAFEAAVMLHDAGEVFTYPISLRAPLDMEYDAVTRALSELACRRHARGTETLRARREEAMLEHLPLRVQQATSALWERILGRAA